jgi:DNA-binding XRE family transcriptional regulator
MKATQRSRLAKAGWKTGTVKEFLGLTDEEAAFIEVKLALTDRFRDLRRRLRLSQAAAAQRIGSSQSRVAKLEAGDSSVSLDLLVRALLALGETTRGLGRAISRAA